MARASSNPFVVTIEPRDVAVPAWFAAMPDRTWATPVSNWLGAEGVLDPRANGVLRGATGPASIVIAWTGMGCDQERRTLFTLGNGGHNDYYGNEVYSVSLGTDSPAWVRRRDGSDPSDGDTVPIWDDGRPSSDHTGFHTVAAEGRWFKLGMGSVNYTGFSRGYWWEYDVGGTEDWINHGDRGYASVALAVSAAYDPATRRLIQVRPNNSRPAFLFADLDTMETIDEVIADINNAGGHAASVDTTHRILALWPPGSNDRLYTLALDDPHAGLGMLPLTGGPPGKPAIHWHAPSRAFLSWGGDGSVWLARPVVRDGRYESIRWETVPPDSPANAPPAGPGQGMYNKVQLIDDMGNGQSALVVVPRWGAPDVFVYKVPAAGL